MLSLFVQPPRAPGYQVDLGDRATLGRSASCTIRLPEDLSLSRQHAEIRREGEGFVVCDLGSRNGTFLNGRPVGADGTAVQEGDSVRIGETLITVGADQAARIEIGTDRGLPDSTGTLILKMEELLAQGEKPADASADAEAASESRLVARFGRHLAKFEALSQAGALVTANRPLEELLAAILDQIFQLLPAERGAIVLRDGERLVPMATRHRDADLDSEPIQISRSIADLAIEDRSAISTVDAQADPRFSGKASIRLAGIRSAVCAPLFTGQEVLGLLYIDTLVAERTFDWDDLTLLSTLAVITAMKIENQRLLRSFLEKERLERELDIAKEISEHLLPLRPPEIPGYELFARNVPCRAIGGDYFDFVLTNDTLHFVIADVCGKGIPAALMMASLQASFRAYVEVEPAPGGLLARLNDVLVRSSPSNKYATVFYGRLGTESGSLVYVNGGHNPPLLLDHRGGTSKLARGGMVCGLFEGATYVEGEARMESGDTLMLYTDGLTDEESATGEQVGAERLHDWLRESNELPLPDTGARILERVDAWCDGGTRFDDRTLMLVRRMSDRQEAR